MWHDNAMESRILVLSAEFKVCINNNIFSRLVTNRVCDAHAALHDCNILTTCTDVNIHDSQIS